MKKLFLTVALVGGMLSFAAMNTSNTVEPVKQTKTVVVVEAAELPTPECISFAFDMEDIDGAEMAYADFDQLVRDCESW